MKLAAPTSVVILGAGQAGVWAAKTLRDEGYGGPITVVGEEMHAPYERPPLSKALLKGEVPSATAQVFSDDTLAALQVHWKRGVKAESLDLGARTVALADGEELCYDKLLVCTGGRAVLPALPGIDLPGIFTLRTLDDCHRMREAVNQAKRICIIGGGWIGLEVAATAREMGKSVTLLHKAERVCERVLPQEVSASLLALHQHHGVDVRLNVEASEISRENSSLVVRSTGDDCVDADAVVLAVGLAPNDEMAAAAGLRCGRGILVDSQCRTSNEHVFAAGDVAVAPNKWAGQAIRLESWQNATDQAVVAAKALLGQDAKYDPLPWFWSDQFGMNLQLYGWPQQRHRVVVRQLEGPNSQIHFLLNGKKVESAIAINAARDLRGSRRLIEKGVEVEDDELRDKAVKLASL